MARRMIVLGITGGIGTGKSVLAGQCALLGAKTMSSDALAHALIAPGGAAEAEVKRRFPDAVAGGRIDRARLGAIVFADAAKRRALEAIVHPLVFAAERRFARRMRALGAGICVFDIPLLFETGGEARCDLVIAAAAPPPLQKQRVLARPGMTPEKFRAVAASQLGEREKQARADFVVHTGLGRGYSMRQLKTLWAQMACAK